MFGRYTSRFDLPLLPSRIEPGRVLSCGASLAVTEWLYKLHSFTLELMAFLLTWLILELARTSLTRRSQARSTSPRMPGH